MFGFSQRRLVTGSSCCSPSLSWSPTRSAPTTTSLSTTATPPPSRSLEGLKCLCKHKNDVANSKVLWVEASPSSHCNRVFNAACLQVRCLSSTESELRTIIQYDTVQLVNMMLMLMWKRMSSRNWVTILYQATNPICFDVLDWKNVLKIISCCCKNCIFPKNIVYLQESGR